MITYLQMSSVGLEEKRLTKQILLSSGHETLLQKEQKGERNVEIKKRRLGSAFSIFRTYSACKIISYYLRRRSQLVVAIRTVASWVSAFSDTVILRLRSLTRTFSAFAQSRYQQRGGPYSVRKN